MALPIIAPWCRGTCPIVTVSTALAKPPPQPRLSMTTPIALHLRTVPGRYAVAQLPADAPIPAWANAPGFSAIVRASDELTIVCQQEHVPADIPGTLRAERDWICLRTVGPFDFQAAGIVYALIQPLSTQGVGVFVVCTFDGEHLLIAARDEEKARALLAAAGHDWPSL